VYGADPAAVEAEVVRAFTVPFLEAVHRVEQLELTTVIAVGELKQVLLPVVDLSKE